MERPRSIGAAGREVVDEGYIDGLPARFEGELHFVPVEDIAVEGSRAVEEEEAVDRVTWGLLAFCKADEEREQKRAIQAF